MHPLLKPYNLFDINGVATAFDTDGGPVVRDPQKSCLTTRAFKPSGPMDHRNFQL